MAAVPFEPRRVGDDRRTSALVAFGVASVFAGMSLLTAPVVVLGWALSASEHVYRSGHRWRSADVEPADLSAGSEHGGERPARAGGVTVS